MPKTRKTTPKAEYLDLTKAQEFYIKGNVETLSRKQIAADLDISVEVVDAFVDRLRKLEPPQLRADVLFHRPAGGVVAMTEASSMYADDVKKRGTITQDEINRAASSGNAELATELARQREEGLSDAGMKAMARHGNFIHKIRPDR